ncbi:hypothetical protein Q8A67_008236 [Cirrhinus molitorella]|uniref:Uncharacterized protein n=1 Tax=Cirrhinus molitorella TaxID=172907 RepID=A0AA88PWE1_9TELE|nr:hypothetical protein Q8A67_008236 [Cirrhinus molitorella]
MRHKHKCVHSVEDFFTQSSFKSCSTRLSEVTIGSVSLGCGTIGPHAVAVCLCADHIKEAAAAGAEERKRASVQPEGVLMHPGDAGRTRPAQCCVPVFNGLSQESRLTQVRIKPYGLHDWICCGADKRNRMIRSKLLFGAWLRMNIHHWWAGRSEKP